MRPVRHPTAEEENFRLEPMFSPEEIQANPRLGDMSASKRDPIEPEPVGTIVLMAFRITGYDQDCDGSLMARLENIDEDGDTTGWNPGQLGLYGALVATLDEWKGFFKRKTAG